VPGVTWPWISADELEISDAVDRRTTQVANLACFATKLFDFVEDGQKSESIRPLLQNAVVTLLGDRSELSADVEELLLGLNVQVGIREFPHEGGAEAKEQFLEELFVGLLEERLRERRSSADLSPMDHDLLASAQTRMEALFAEISAMGSDDEKTCKPSPVA
jgi:hypothetical protein